MDDDSYFVNTIELHTFQVSIYSSQKARSSKIRYYDVYQMWRCHSKKIS